MKPAWVLFRKSWLELLEHEQERIQAEISKGWTFSASTRAILESKILHTEVQALRLNDLVLVSFPGEIFSKTGLALKQAYPRLGIAVVELANDAIGYIPTRQAFEEGGYEVARNLWGRVTPDATEMLIDAAHTAIKKVV
jgi:hypothetical protein